MNVKRISLGMVAGAAILFSAASCGNKADNAAQQDAEQATETLSVEAAGDTAQAAEMAAVADDAAIVAYLDQLTPEQGVERGKEIKTTPSGLKYRVIKEGKGNSPKATDKVEVNYEGRTLDGKIFDSSYERGQSIEFPLSAVIPGWTEGVQLMKEGAVYEFYIPSNLAYGERGAGPNIAPNSDLTFKVELIKIVK